jgi:Zn finger protein HypA/HybF involved in hydrogenase expression
MNATMPACRCNVCSELIEFDPSRARQTISCPHCGMDTILFVPMPAPVFAPVRSAVVPLVLEPDILTAVGTARRKLGRKTSMAGLAMELLGFILLFLFPIGTIIGIAFLIAGFNASKIWRCSSCGNILADKQIRMCPACRALLK